MFILTTLDDFFPAIWERDGIAKYDSYFERQGVVARMKATLVICPMPLVYTGKTKKCRNVIRLHCLKYHQFRSWSGMVDIHRTFL